MGRRKDRHNEKKSLCSALEKRIYKQSECVLVSMNYSVLRPPRDSEERKKIAYSAGERGRNLNEFKDYITVALIRKTNNTKFKWPHRFAKLEYAGKNAVDATTRQSFH